MTSDHLWLFRELFQCPTLTYDLQLCQLPDVCRQRLKVVITQVESTQGRCNTGRSSHQPLRKKKVQTLRAAPAGASGTQPDVRTSWTSPDLRTSPDVKTSGTGP